MNILILFHFLVFTPQTLLKSCKKSKDYCITNRLEMQCSILTLWCRLSYCSEKQKMGKKQKKLDFSWNDLANEVNNLTFRSGNHNMGTHLKSSTLQCVWAKQKQKNTTKNQCSGTKVGSTQPKAHIGVPTQLIQQISKENHGWQADSRYPPDCKGIHLGKKI